MRKGKIWKKTMILLLRISVNLEEHHQLGWSGIFGSEACKNLSHRQSSAALLACEFLRKVWKIQTFVNKS